MLLFICYFFLDGNLKILVMQNLLSNIFLETNYKFSAFNAAK
jgi:hypothetical protein